MARRQGVRIIYELLEKHETLFTGRREPTFGGVRDENIADSSVGVRQSLGRSRDLLLNPFGNKLESSQQDTVLASSVGRATRQFSRIEKLQQ